MLNETCLIFRLILELFNPLKLAELFVKYEMEYMKWNWSLPQHTFKDIWTEILTHSFAGLTYHVFHLSCTLEIRHTSTKFIITLVGGRKSSLHLTITQVHVHVTNIPTNYAIQWQKIINQSPNFHVKTLSSNPKHRLALERATSTLYWG